ncbi:MAG: DUF2628 domain-containing protein [Firmicutes bacterium]|nr:DUF2628 domain-containing protein [Bacillota bacterium]
MNYCPKCGFHAEGMNFCPKCGFELKYPVSDVSEEVNDNTSGQQTEQIAAMDNTVKDDITSDSEKHTETHSDNEKRELRRALIGKNAEHYLPIFELLDKPNEKSGNWCAFFFSALWFAYRKMYGWMLIAMLVPWAVGFVVTYIAMINSTGNVSWNTIENIMAIAFSIFFGLAANKAYKNHIDNLIEKVPSKGKEKEYYIESKGGVSTGSAALALLIILLLRFLPLTVAL